MALTVPERVDVTDNKHSDISEFAFPAIQAPTVAYLRLHTELKMSEVFEAIKMLDVKTRQYSGLHYNFYLLLTGLLVKFSKADDTYYIPIPLIPGDTGLRVYWDEKLLNRESMRAKLQVGKVPRLLLYRQRAVEVSAFPEMFQWELPGTTFKSQSLEIKDANNKFRLYMLPLDRKIAQIVFYGPVHTQSWLKKGRLWQSSDTGDTLLAEFQEPFEATVFDKERLGLPLTQNAAVYTFSFVNYLKEKSSTAQTALVLKEAPILEFDVDAQFLTANPVIDIWCVAEAV